MENEAKGPSVGEQAALFSGKGRTMKHQIITIGCEYGAKGNAIGKKVAEMLGIKFYDRDLVDSIIDGCTERHYGKSRIRCGYRR